MLDPLSRDRVWDNEAGPRAHLAGLERWLESSCCWFGYWDLFLVFFLFHRQQCPQHQRPLLHTPRTIDVRHTRRRSRRRAQTTRMFPSTTLSTSRATLSACRKALGDQTIRHRQPRRIPISSIHPSPRTRCLQRHTCLRWHVRHSRVRKARTLCSCIAPKTCHH